MTEVFKNEDFTLKRVPSEDPIMVFVKKTLESIVDFCGDDLEKSIQLSINLASNVFITSIDTKADINEIDEYIDYLSSSFSQMTKQAIRAMIRIENDLD